MTVPASPGPYRAGEAVVKALIDMHASEAARPALDQARRRRRLQPQTAEERQRLTHRRKVLIELKP